MPTITDISQLNFDKQYSYSDYLLWKFNERVELIRGFIKKMSPSPSLTHQTVSQNLSANLYLYFRPSNCRLFSAPFDVILPLASEKKDTTVVQPDLCVVCDESKLNERGCHGAPDLVVEIISKNNPKYDIDTKFKLYEEAGVQEYWIIEPYDKILLVYTLKNGVYIGLQPQSIGDSIKSPLFPEMDIALDDVFDKVK